MTPAIRAGKGVTGTPGACSQAFLPPELDACLCGHIDRDKSVTHWSAPPPPGSTRLRFLFVRPVSVESRVVDMPVHGEHAGAARVRRERKMRSFWLHEQMAVQMAPFARRSTEPEDSHQDWERGTICTTRPSSGSASDQEGRPAPLPEVAGWQERVERHVMEDLGSVCPFVQILDLPVPQTVDNVTDALRILDLQMAEQVIEVPKISCSPCPSRSLIPEPQSADQLVEVPTVLSLFAHRGADRLHSSSSGSWQAACSRFSPRTEFNSDAFFFGTHF